MSNVSAPGLSNVCPRAQLCRALRQHKPPTSKHSQLSQQAELYALHNDMSPLTLHPEHNQAARSLYATAESMLLNQLGEIIVIRTHQSTQISG